MYLLCFTFIAQLKLSLKSPLNKTEEKLFCILYECLFHRCLFLWEKKKETPHFSPSNVL